MVSQYRNLQSKNNRSSINGLKICIETAINTISKFASLFSENEAKEEEQSSPVKLDPVEDSQLVKVSPSPSQSDAQSTQSANSNSMGSPIKRRISTYELLVPTSMSQASQSSQDTQSPRKRRKIGSLFKNEYTKIVTYLRFINLLYSIGHFIPTSYQPFQSCLLR